MWEVYSLKEVYGIPQEIPHPVHECRTVSDIYEYCTVRIQGRVQPHNTDEANRAMVIQLEET
jgi:hypothetical protein